MTQSNKILVPFIQQWQESFPDDAIIKANNHTKKKLNTNYYQYMVFPLSPIITNFRKEKKKKTRENSKPSHAVQ